MTGVGGFHLLFRVDGGVGQQAVGRKKLEMPLV
jgi:hypothetical protein